MISEEELADLGEMFPSIDKEVIRSVLEARNGDKNSAVTDLIEMAN